MAGLAEVGDDDCNSVLIESSRSVSKPFSQSARHLFIDVEIPLILLSPPSRQMQLLRAELFPPPPLLFKLTKNEKKKESFLFYYSQLTRHRQIQQLYFGACHSDKCRKAGGEGERS